MLKRTFLEGERGALLALLCLRLFLLLQVACAQLHRALSCRQLGCLFKLNLAAPVGGIMHGALHRERALAIGGCDHVVDAFQAVVAGAGRHARDGVEESFVVGQAQLPTLGSQAADRVAQQPVRRAVDVADRARGGAR